jgi:hypothetical protein
MVVVDEAGDDARAVARSWTRIEPVPASGPTDPGIATAHAYAEAVPRIGFCAPTRAGDAGPSADAGTRLEVAVWRVERAAGPQAASAVPLDLAVDAGGTFGDGGALYAPPAGTSGGRGSGDEAAGANGDDASSPAAGAGPGDPEAAWSIDGAAPWRPAGWSTGPTLAEVGGWPPGTYVFRVDLAGTEPGGGAEGWLAVELRGPWLGPDAAAPPSDRDGRTPDPGPAAAPAAPSSRP